jgi:hypothetical protein
MNTHETDAGVMVMVTVLGSGIIKRPLHLYNTIPSQRTLSFRRCFHRELCTVRRTPARTCPCPYLCPSSNLGPQNSNRGTTESDLYPPRPRSQPVHGGTIGPSFSSELDRPSGAKLLPQIVSRSRSREINQIKQDYTPSMDRRDGDPRPRHSVTSLIWFTKLRHRGRE